MTGAGCAYGVGDCAGIVVIYDAESDGCGATFIGGRSYRLLRGGDELRGGGTNQEVESLGVG
jgi:hypothetical protein